ncbi:hypothetical protein TNCV_4636111 [Trichonephila clavipes]|uniref:Uncharacterized protein n=1 Tax=Trichonephila clavipes TaxID=2585209 RepID=A0A8X6R701_TRICX|nr:hypothetical protein TNCV_4636111 [Trichonephila clavipes]
MTAQYYTAKYKDSFATKSVNFCYAELMKASCTISPDEDSTRINLSEEFRLIIEKNTLHFLWCPRLMFSAP